MDIAYAATSSTYGSGYGYGSSVSSAAGASGFWPIHPVILFILIILWFIVIIAWIVSISLLVDESKRKGHYKTGMLWFIGLFASPIVLGLYVIALPDLSGVGAEREKDVDNELPVV